MIVKYNWENIPTFTGIYACRIEDEDFVPFLKDIFLYWDNEKKKWGYPKSDQFYRGSVLGWLGPLERKRMV